MERSLNLDKAFISNLFQQDCDDILVRKLRFLSYLWMMLTYILDELIIPIVHITSKFRSDALSKAGFPDSWTPDYDYRGHIFEL